MKAKFIRFEDEEAARMLEQLAAEDLRTEGNTAITLIRKEFELRQAKKRPTFPAVTSYPPVIVPIEPENNAQENSRS